MNLINTLKTNARDILWALAIMFVVAFLADFITDLSATQSGKVWLATVADLLKGISRFFAANMVGFVGVAVAWPTINRFSNDKFSETWTDKFSDRDRLITMIAVGCAYVGFACISLAG